MGMFSTPTKLSLQHACIYSLPVDLFSILAGLQTLPTTLGKIIDIIYRYPEERGDAENFSL
jgi:hypothetical protein